MTSGTSTAQPGTARSNVRWVIVALLFWVSLSNFLDRSVLGNLAPEMPKYLHMADDVKPAEVAKYWKDHGQEVYAAVGTTGQAAKSDAATMERCVVYVRTQIAKNSWTEWYWNINTAFTAAYAISMLLMGRLMDLWGLRWGFAFACTLWMSAEILHSVAPEIGGLFGSAVVGFLICRILLGLGEGGVSPAVNKAIAEWFPKKERALATGVAAGASAVGGMLVPWLMPALLALFSGVTIAGLIVGWRGMFILTGAIDILLVFVWVIYYRNPEEHSQVNAAERSYIQSDSAVEPKVKVPWSKLVPHRQTWAFVCAKSLTDFWWWFYLFGSPDFFSRKFNLGPADRKYMVMLVYLVAAIGAVAGGWLAGKFMSLGWTVNRARKMTLLVCALVTVPVFYSGLTSSKWLAAVLITLAAAAHQAWGANVYCLASDMFPKRTVGSLIGIAGVFGTGTSMLLMYMTGQIVKATGTYLPIFFMASAAYVFALVLLQLLAPKLAQAKVDDDLVAAEASVSAARA